MSPEAFEFVEVLLNRARPTPGASFFHKIQDELFHGKGRLPFIEGGPDSGPVRRQSSEAEEVAVPWDPAPAIRWIDVTDELQKPHQGEERVASDPSGTKGAM